MHFFCTQTMEKDKVKTFNSVIQAINDLNQQSSCFGKRILKYISSRLSIDEELIKRPVFDIHFINLQLNKLLDI